LSSKINGIVNNLPIKAVTTSAIIQALEELLFDSHGTLNQFFTNLLQDLMDSKAEDCKETLIAIAHGLYRQRELSKWTGYNKRETSKHLKILIEKNLIYPLGNVYRFYDKVLRFWLKRVHYKRRTTLVDNILEKARNFRYDIDDMVQQFFAESRLGITLRIKGLLDSFNNEIVEINSKRRRLMHFSKTEMVQEGEGKYIVGHFGSKLCLVYLPNQKLDENGVLEFLKYSMRYKPGLQRRIILPLDDMDINATIMAKEMKIWIWDFDVVNELLDIFGRQKIVRIE